MHTFVTILQSWQETLAPLYPEREINNLFRFTLEDLFGLTSAQQLIQKNEEQTEAVCLQLEEILRRLHSGEPLQYIIGFTWFDGLKITVSPAVLIPRPETEELVQWAVELLPTGFSGSIVDWCTGSGCIALALKNRFPKSAVVGYDRSEIALGEARLNANELQLEVEFEEHDALKDEIIYAPADVIISNPPYIPVNESARMRSNVLHFEPEMALFVPDDAALIFYEAITRKAISSLKPGGLLLFELHEDYALETAAMVGASGEFKDVEVRKDLSGKNRMLKAVKN